MVRSLRIGLGVLVTVLVGVAIAVALIGRERSLELALGPIDRTAIDFATLDRGQRRNDFLMCPDDLCAAASDENSPVFDAPVTEMRDRWMAMIDRQPRVELVAADGDALQYDFVQRSQLFRFPDTVTVRFVERSGGGSTLAVYSRAHYGISDFGVNRQRVVDWLAALPGGT